jgi:molybdenum cofactor cytidylyltransferase
MGYSIAAGVRHSQEADGWLICLGDMPYVQAETIAQISAVAIKHPDAIVAPFYQGRRGHPVFIPKSFKQDLLSLQKDEGPRHLMMGGPLIQVDTMDTGIYRDIDLPSDLT